MFIFTPFSYTILFAFILLCASVGFFNLFLLINSTTSVVLTISYFSILQESFDVSILLSPMSCIFSWAVTSISCAVYCFILVYFDSWNNISYFCWYTLAFVLCMLVLINFNDFFFVMLGWDGLGVSSYFLILYYQSPSSIYSASFTLLINRLGDCFLVLFIILIWSIGTNTHYIIESNLLNSLLPFLLFIALSTNSALFPFSPWLPAAMAAPTPISSLVHSSTLVTAGLFLIIQNTSILSSSSLAYFILVTSLFTSLYAGLSALIESDLNKIVALSTLSHLGFIGMAISLNLPHLAFFHLLTHAFFNSSLFISVGIYIVSLGHYQDSRVVSSTSNYSPFFTTIVLVSESNLLGLPFLSGFYSNDLILELSQHSFLGISLVIIIYFNVLLTFTYSLRIFLSLSNNNNNTTITISSNTILPWYNVFIFSLFILSVISISFGLVFSKIIIQAEIPVPTLLNFLPITILFLTITLFLLNNTPFLFSNSNSLSYFLSSIIFLTPIWANIAAQAYIKIANNTLYLEESFINSTILSFLTITLNTIASYSSYIFVTTSGSSSKVSLLLLIAFSLYIFL